MSTAPDDLLAMRRPTVASIDIDAFRRNVTAVHDMLPSGSRLVAVLKADAYGHGAVELATACGDDVSMIAVALLEEAVELRVHNVSKPILILGAITADQVPIAAKYALSIALPSPEVVDMVCEYANRTGTSLSAHLKLDTGMGRMGLVEADLESAAVTLRNSELVTVSAIYTHFASASDPDDPFTQVQSARFSALLRQLANLGIEAPTHHLANSAATVRRLVRAGAWARVGLALLGGEPLDRGTSRLEAVMRWSTRIVRIKSIGPGSAVGYGATFRATRTTRIATLPAGYADGYDRLLSNRGEVLIRGRRAPVVGRVSMDLITVDVTDVPEAAVGDEVVLMGSQGSEEITAEEIAEKTGTISHEVFCKVSARVPRVYVSGEKQWVRSRFDLTEHRAPGTEPFRK